MVINEMQNMRNQLLQDEQIKAQEQGPDMQGLSYYNRKATLIRKDTGCSTMTEIEIGTNFYQFLMALIGILAGAIGAGIGHKIGFKKGCNQTQSGSNEDVQS